MSDDDSNNSAQGFSDWLRAIPLPAGLTFGKLKPFAISLTVHAALILLMASWVLPLLSHGSSSVNIQAVVADNQQDALENLSQDMNFDVTASESTDLSKLQATASTDIPASSPNDVATESESPTIPTEVQVRRSDLQALTRLSEDDMMQELNLGVRAMAIHDHRGQTRVEEASDAVGIASTLEGDLLSIAKDGDAMVVWVLDQSLSMQQDIKILAEGLLDTLQEIEDDKTSKMQHAVVAFGDNVRIVQDPTFNGFRVANAIYKLPPDPSGIERTFESVEWCVNRMFSSRYRGGARQHLLVLWTDESGDDYQRLENTIANCVRSNVRVDVIGPSAVLGAQTGYTAYRHPADGQTYYLPVHRGPDSAFPQKLSLGYWYRGVPSTHDESFRGPYQGTSPRWQGGSNLQSMLSGFSPYALTRLSRETGGRYLMYDRPGDRAPFSLEQIRDYQPDYRSLAEIQFQLQRQPLRQVVLASAARTWNGGGLAQTQPDMTFRPSYGGQLHADYVRTRLVPMLTREIRTAWRDAQAVEEALQPFLMASAMSGFKPNQEASGYRPPVGPRGNRNASRKKKEATETAASDEEIDKNDDKELKKIKELSSDEVQLSTLDTEVNESLLEQLYHNETSPRWRAWTDLNMGRLLALSVRLREYLIVSTGLLNNLDQLRDDTNFVSFSQSSYLQGGTTSEQRLEVARRFLERCVEENSGTPWQVLAERELRDSFGLGVTQRYIPRPTRPTRSIRMTPPPPRPKLPNL